eukprot:1285295-Pyramimonas_sp.AAC.1
MLLVGLILFACMPCDGGIGPKPVHGARRNAIPVTKDELQSLRCDFLLIRCTAHVKRSTVERRSFELRPYQCVQQRLTAYQSVCVVPQKGSDENVLSWLSQLYAACVSKGRRSKWLHSSNGEVVRDWRFDCFGIISCKQGCLHIEYSTFGATAQHRHYMYIYIYIIYTW